MGCLVAKSPPSLPDQHKPILRYTSTFTKGFIKGNDATDKARRLKLHDLSQKDFPGGRVPDPYIRACNLFDGRYNKHALYSGHDQRLVV